MVFYMEIFYGQVVKNIDKFTPIFSCNFIHIELFSLCQFLIIGPICKIITLILYLLKNIFRFNFDFIF